MIQAELVLQFLVIALDAPTQFRQAHQLRQRRLGRHRGKPELGRRRFVAGPFDEQPLLGVRLVAVLITVGRADANTGKPRTHPATGTLPPGNSAPSVSGQPRRQFGDGDLPMTRTDAYSRVRTTTTPPPPGTPRRLARQPERGFAGHSDDIGDPLTVPLM